MGELSSAKRSLVWLFNEVLRELRGLEEGAMSEFGYDSLADKKELREKLKRYRERFKRILENLDEEVVE